MDLDYDAWLRWVFDHPVETPAWYSSESHRDITGPETVNFIIRLFEDPRSGLDGFQENQIGQGLWFLISNACSSHLDWVFDNRTPLERRLRFVRSNVVLFQELFARRCEPAIGCDAQDELEMVCGMWWDLWRDAIPGWLGGIILDGQLPPEWRTELAILRALRRILQIPHDACRRSALHGLGHWYQRTPRSAASIVDRFLADNPVMRPELRAYAIKAGKGKVL